MEKIKCNYHSHKTKIQLSFITRNVQNFGMPCFSAKFFASSSLRAEQATTVAVGRCLRAWVKSCETLPQPIIPYLRGGHSSGFDTDSSSRGGGGKECTDGLMVCCCVA